MLITLNFVNMELSNCVLLKVMYENKHQVRLGFQ